jgi:hypothetical protein
VRQRNHRPRRLAVVVQHRDPAQAGSIGHTDELRALLHRVRAYALAQKGDAESAAEALRWSLEIARKAEETYEAALTLEAMGRLTGEEVAAEDSRALLARLGVVSTPQVPA